MTKTASSTIRELPKIWTPEAEWTIPQAQGKPVFLFPAFGPCTYNKVIEQVMANRERGANLPTGVQSAFMLDEAYNPSKEDGSVNQEVKNSERSKFVRDDIIRDRWLWVPSVKVWTPKDIKNPGMYSVFDEKGEGLARKYTTEELEDRLLKGETWSGVRFSQDRTVAFAPLNTIRSGYHEKGTLAHDGVFIASYDVEGSEALDRVANQFRNIPYSRIVDNNSGENIQTLSALDWYRSLNGDRLVAYFNSDGDDWGGYVVSVSGSNSVAEGTAQKN